MTEMRLISTGIRESSVAINFGRMFEPKLAIFALDVWEHGFIMSADHVGRGRYLPEILLAKSFTFALKIIVELPDDFMEQVTHLLVSEGALVRYEVNKQQYYYCTGFGKYQNYRYKKPSVIPMPPAGDYVVLLTVDEERIADSEYAPCEVSQATIAKAEKEADEILSAPEKPKRAKAVKREPPSLLVLESQIPDEASVAWQSFAAMVAGKRTTGKVSPNILCGILDALLHSGLSWGALVYGLNAATAKRADNVNYILKSARGYVETADDIEVVLGEFD